MSKEMAETKELTQYTANCHCGAVRLSFSIPRLEEDRVNRCNCSICTRNGYLLVYPLRIDFAVTHGEEKLSSYLFASRKKPHRFCKECGSSMYIDFSNSDFEVERQMVAVNIRMVPGIESYLGKLPYRDVKGKEKLEPQYTVI